MSQELRKDNLTLMPSKYPEELRARATRLAVEARKDPDTRTGAISRIAEQTGVHKEALRTWVGCVKECGQSLRVFLLCSGRLDEVFSGAVVIVPSLYRCPVAQR